MRTLISPSTGSTFRAGLALALLALAATAARAQAPSADLAAQQAAAWMDAQRTSAEQMDLSGLPPYQPSYKVQGTIKVFASFLKNQIELLEKGFLKYHPDLQFSNQFQTSSEGAMAGLYLGGADLAPAGDDAKIPDMMPFYNTYHYLPFEISIATGGYEGRGTLWPAVIVVNKDNPIAHVSMRQLDCILGSERTGGWEVPYGAAEDILYTSRYARGPETNIRTWGKLGLTGEWADKKIQTYGYIAPGFVIYMQRKLFHWSDKWNPNYKEYVEAKEATADDQGRAVASERMLEALTGDKYGLGWAAHLHAKDYPGIKELPVGASDAGPFVAPTPETIRNRTYPLIRDAYVYLNRDPLRPLDPRVKEFLRFILSREGQAIIAHGGIFYPFTPEALQENLKKIEQSASVK